MVVHSCYKEAGPVGIDAQVVNAAFEIRPAMCDSRDKAPDCGAPAGMVATAPAQRRIVRHVRVQGDSQCLLMSASGYLYEPTSYPPNLMG